MCFKFRSWKIIFSLSNKSFNNNIAILESKIIYFCLRSNFRERNNLKHWKFDNSKTLKDPLKTFEFLQKYQKIYANSWKDVYEICNTFQIFQIRGINRIFLLFKAMYKRDHVTDSVIFWSRIIHTLSTQMDFPYQREAVAW